MPPERLHELQRLQRSIAERPELQAALQMQADLTRKLEPLVRRAREAQARLLTSEQREQLERVQRAIASRPEVLDALEQVREFAERARAELLDALPANWQPLGIDRLEDLIELTTERGVAVVWAPRSEIVAKLLEAGTDSERDEILAAHRNEVVDDLAGVVAGIDSVALDGPVRAAADAIAAAREGHDMPAQSLVGSTLTHFINIELGHARFDVARTEIRRSDPGKFAVHLLRQTALLHCLANAIEHTNHAKYGFNRHATAGHDQMFDQYGEANCLRGLLLLVGLLREFSLLES